MKFKAKAVINQHLKGGSHFVDKPLSVREKRETAPSDLFLAFQALLDLASLFSFGTQQEVFSASRSRLLLV
jgi:hypothetical protein